MDKKFEALERFINNEGKQLSRISNLAMDINPKEIASHIEDDTLGQWCKSWYDAVMSSIDTIRKYEITLIKETIENV